MQQSLMSPKKETRCLGGDATGTGSPWAAKSQCPIIKGQFPQGSPLAAPHTERGRQVPLKLALVGLMDKQAESNKGNGGKGDSGGREWEAMAMFSESPSWPLPKG